MSDFFVGITGASGHLYAQTWCAASLLAGQGVHVSLSPAGNKVMAHEMGLDPGANAEKLEEVLPAWLPGIDLSNLTVHPSSDIGAKPASGTANLSATILCPCSMGSLARVAAGFSSNLVERAADVALKEGRPLLLMPRETPLSIVHLENMTRLAKMGGHHLALHARSLSWAQHDAGLDRSRGGQGPRSTARRSLLGQALGRASRCSR